MADLGKFDEKSVREALAHSWSLQTAPQWTAENPALGHCNVTAAVIQDLYGGDILRTWLPDVWHYYNRIDGIVYDLTDSQFSAPGSAFETPSNYADELSSSEAAMENIPQREFDTLKAALNLKLKDE